MKKITYALSGMLLFAVSSFAQPLQNDSNYFPIAVWVQSADNAKAYRDNGINMYVSLWKGLDQPQFDLLKAAGMKLITHQNEFGLSKVKDPMIYAWMHGDEPDNAQWNATTKKYAPCIDPSVIIKSYTDIKKKDPTHPVYLNLSQGVAWPGWYGRGTCTGNLDMYKVANNGYLKGSDIASFDIYPVNNTDTATQNNLWYVAEGVKNLRIWSDNQQPAWCWIETTNIHGAKGSRKPTAAEVRAEVWMALIHGAKGFGYFCHTFAKPEDDAALLHDPAMISAVKKINLQVTGLAPVLNSVDIADYASAVSSNSKVPVDIVSKAYKGAGYIFSVGMRSGFTTATFQIKSGKQVEVVGENRSIRVINGKFEDDFTPFQVHLYKITG